MASKNQYDWLRVNNKKAIEQMKLDEALKDNLQKEQKDKRNLNASYNEDVNTLTDKLATQKETESLEKAKAQAEYTAQKRAATLKGILSGLGESGALKKAENTVEIEAQNAQNDISYKSSKNQEQIKKQLQQAKNNYISKLNEIEIEKNEKDKAAQSEYKRALLNFYYQMAAQNAKP